MRAAAAVAVLLGSVAAPAAAASFDCAKARSPAEVAVCRDPGLSELDATMGALFFAYGKVPMLMGSSGARHDDARQFLAARSACGANTACLRTAYTRRIAGLKGDITQAMQVMFQLQNGDRPAASPPSPGDLPAGVAATLSLYPGQCRTAGGKPDGGQPRILSGDIDGDGAPDYVVDPVALVCTGAATAYCGNGGCMIDVLLSSSGFAPPLRLLGGAPSLTSQVDATILTLAVDATNCNVPKWQATCAATYQFAGGKAAATYAATPRAKN